MKKLFFFAMCILVCIITVSVFTLSSCESNDDNQIVCTQEFVYGLKVKVSDAASGQPITSGLTVKATDGNYNEVLEAQFGEIATFIGAGERKGQYTVTVTKTGYQTYTSSVISVAADKCHVIQQQLNVNLVPN